MEDTRRPIDYILEIDVTTESPSMLEVAAVVALGKGLGEDLISGRYTTEEVAKLYELMRERSFSRTLNKALKQLKGMINTDPKAIVGIKNLQMLINTYFTQEKSNKSKELLKDYLDIVLEIINFYDYYILRVIREWYGSNISDMTQEQKDKLQELLYIPSEQVFNNLIIPVVDELLVRKNNM